MKNVAIFAALASMALATPAFAQSAFTGSRVEVTTGIDDVTGARDTTKVKYGVGVGFDTEVLKNVIVGVEATADNVFDRRDLSAGARLGYVLTPNLMVFGKVGYANLKLTPNNELEGLRVGGGLETKLVDRVYAKVEYRYTDFNKGVGQHAGLVGIGLRF